VAWLRLSALAVWGTRAYCEADGVPARRVRLLATNASRGRVSVRLGAGVRFGVHRRFSIGSADVERADRDARESVSDEKPCLVASHDDAVRPAARLPGRRPFTAVLRKAAHDAGHKRDDRLRGTSKPDVIAVFSGDDHVDRVRPGDVVCTGLGDDVVTDARGVTQVELGEGDDVLTRLTSARFSPGPATTGSSFRGRPPL